MSTEKSELETDWLDEAISHLAALVHDAAEHADEGDILPTSRSLIAAKELLKAFNHANAPTIGLTVNGEFALTWEGVTDTLKVYVMPDASVEFFRNKTLIDETTFRISISSGRMRQ